MGLVILVLSLISIGLSIAGQQKNESSPVVYLEMYIEENGCLKFHSRGTGFLFDSRGLVVTADHILYKETLRGKKYADLILVFTTSKVGEPPQPKYLAKILKEDEENDFALLRVVKEITDIKRPLGITGPECLQYTQASPGSLELPFIKLGNSDNLELGDKLDIKGYPTTPARGTIGFDILSTLDLLSYSRGYIASIDRIANRIFSLAPVTPGLIGSPAINSSGQVVGIVVGKEELTVEEMKKWLIDQGVDPLLITVLEPDLKKYVKTRTALSRMTITPINLIRLALTHTYNELGFPRRIRISNKEIKDVVIRNKVAYVLAKDEVFIIDLKTDLITQSLPIKAGRKILVSSSKLYVLGENLYVISTQSNDLVTKIPIKGKDMATTPDEKYLLVTASRTTSILDIDKVIRKIPVGGDKIVAKNGKIFYLLRHGSILETINVKPYRVNISLFEESITSMEIGPGGKRIYLLRKGDVAILDIPTGKAHVLWEGTAKDLEINKAGTTIYVLQSSGILVINAKSGKVIKTFPLKEAREAQKIIIDREEEHAFLLKHNTLIIVPL